MSAPFIVGAYASLPEGKTGQEEYYRLLAEENWVSGIEIPFPGDLAEEWAWLAAQIPAHWENNNLTAIPGTMQNVAKNPAFGLASPTAEGRAQALEFFEQIRIRVNQLAETKQRTVVKHLQLHSAPTGKANPAAFAESLEKLTQQDWAGTKIVIEHCDAPRPNRTPEKGFLELAQEIEVAKELGLGIHINWGRSCVEEHSAEAVKTQLAETVKAGVLTGLFYSGAGPEETQYGYAWIDGHLPCQIDEPTSLMDEKNIADCAQIARESDKLAYLGAKICVPKDSSLLQRKNYLEHIYRFSK